MLRMTIRQHDLCDPANSETLSERNTGKREERERHLRMRRSMRDEKSFSSASRDESRGRAFRTQ